MASPTHSDWRGIEVDIRRAASAGGRTDIGRFSLEGTRIFERALEAGVAIETALVAESYRGHHSERIQSLIAALEKTGCALHTVDDEVIQRLTEGRGNGAILGLVRIPEQPELSAALDTGTLLVGVEIEDPGNVGAMVRTARASGAAFAGIGITDPFHPKAVRTSMGNLFKGPTLRYSTWEMLIEELRALGVRTLGAVARGGVPLPVVPLPDVPLDSRPVAVFMGSEAFGLPEELEQALDDLVTIPMAREVSSLSVNAAAAVLLYEIRRRSI